MKKNKTESLKICIECVGKDNVKGTFLKGSETGLQYTSTYISSYELFTSNEYIKLKPRVKLLQTKIYK